MKLLTTGKILRGGGGGRSLASLDAGSLTTVQHSTLKGLGSDPLRMFKCARLGRGKRGSTVHTDPHGRAQPSWLHVMPLLCSGKRGCFHFGKTERQEAVRPNTLNVGKREKWSQKLLRERQLHGGQHQWHSPVSWILMVYLILGPQVHSCSLKGQPNEWIPWCCITCKLV